VKLQVQEDASARTAERLDDLRPGDGKELLANLEEVHQSIETFPELEGGSGIRKIEGDDECRVLGGAR
jgi:hypothetical protein